MGITPRMRGEDKIASLQEERDAGSPPHARGRHRWDAIYYVDPRITPACAGKTSSTFVDA